MLEYFFSVLESYLIYEQQMVIFLFKDPNKNLGTKCDLFPSQPFYF